jgi:nitroreductase
VKTLKTLIQHILGLKIVRVVLKYIYLITLGIFSSNRILSIIYHIVFFPTYSREQHGVLKARFKYYRNLNTTQSTKVDLRRNIHRIEKGLLMKPQRDIFALNYIEETIESYLGYVSQYKNDLLSVDIGELDWSYDVLCSYFASIKGNSKTDKLKYLFESANYSPDTSKKEKDHMSPYYRDIANNIPVDYDSLLNLALKRRSVRWFEQKPVPRELIDKALLVARQSPSACNRLPFEYRIFDKPELVNKISKIPFGAAGYSQNIPTLIVLVGKLNYYFSARDRHVIYIDASLSAMSFMLALETLGLSSSVINWPDFEPVEIKMQNTLKLGVDERPVMLIAIGFPDKDGKVAYSQKKSLEVLRSYN